MKKLTLFFIPGLFILISTTFTACKLMGEDKECGPERMREVEVSIKATIHVVDKNRNPIANQMVRLTLYKKPCGLPIKGQFNFDAPTNAQGIVETSVAYYKLSNMKDVVGVDVYAPQLGNGSAEADSEYATFTYKDFLAGRTKEVDLTIYRNF